MFDKYSMLYDSTAAVTADANGTPLFRTWLKSSGLVACLTVTGTISGTSPTLDVKIQGTNDNGSNWTDIVSFPQKTGTGAYKKYVRFMAPYDQIRAVVDVSGTSPSYGKVQCGLVPAGEYTEP